METAKFKIRTFVTVSGDATGYGNLTGLVKEVEYKKLQNEYFYLVVVNHPAQKSVYVSERFIQPLKCQLVD